MSCSVVGAWSCVVWAQWSRWRSRSRAAAQSLRTGRCRTRCHATSLLLGRTFEPFADPRIVFRGGPGGGGRSVASERGASGQPGAGSVVHRVRCGIARDAFALLSGIDRYDTVLFSVPWWSTSCWRSWRRRSSRSASRSLLLRVVLLRRPGDAGSSRSSIPGPCGSGVSGRDLAGVRLGDVAAHFSPLSTRRWRTPRPRPGARGCSSARRSCSGGRRGPGFLRRGGWRIRFARRMSSPR